MIQKKQGDMIESYIGLFLPISTMAAAGLGNAFSDVAGIGLAHHIEYFCSKLTDEPILTSEQFSLPIVSWFIIIVIQLRSFLSLYNFKSMVAIQMSFKRYNSENFSGEWNGGREPSLRLRDWTESPD